MENCLKHWLKGKVCFTQALLVAFFITGGVGYATNLGSNETNIQIGKGAALQNIEEGNGTVVIGENAKVDSYVNQPGSIAIGKNAFSETMVGRQEKILGFKQSGYNKFGFGSIPTKPEKIVGTITLGNNTYARSGGIMLGSHNYRGKLGDLDIDTDILENRRNYGMGILATTLGANSFTNGILANTTGAYSIISSKYIGNNPKYCSQNFGATISGSLNSIESASSSNEYSGIANAIVGTANRTQNSNGSLIFGSGNEITNSIANIKMPVDPNGFSEVSSAKELSDKLRETVKATESGGATLAIGGGNKADYTQASQLLGVNNTLKGEDGNISKFNLMNGYKNIAKNIQDSYVIGKENTVEEAEDNIITGKNVVLKGSSSSKAKGNIILGFHDKQDENAIKVSAKNVISIGNNTKVTQDGGIALGNTSVADRAEGIVGYDALGSEHKDDVKGVWKSTAAALSLGEKDKVTRQITNVAAGAEDTDAVNVAQLKSLASKVGTGAVKKGDTNTVTGDTVYQAINNKLTNENISTVLEKGEIKSDTLKVTGGSDKVLGKDVSIELKEKSITKTHLTEEITNILDKVGDGVIEKDGEKANHTVTGKAVYEYIQKNASGNEIAYKAGGATESKTVKLSKGFEFQGDTNIQTAVEEGGIVKHTLNSNLTGIKSIENEGTSIQLTKENIAVNDKKITGVQKGTVSEDSKEVIVGSQLHETNTRVNKLENAGKNQMNEIHKNTERIYNVKNEMKHVGALSSALAALHPMQYDPLQPNQVMAGFGSYRDKQAVAVGVTHYFNENLMMTAGISVGEENRVKSMANVGVTWKIGSENDRKDLPERYKEGPIGSIYKMQEEMEEVLKENKNLKEEMAEMKKQLEILLKK